MHLLNGRPAEQISLNDRGLLYGQSLFETIAVSHQQALLLEQHLARLQQGCKALGIPLDAQILVAEINALCASLSDQKAVLRITITMGEGGRGYANPETIEANRILSIHPFPKLQKSNWSDGIRLGLSELRLSTQPATAGIKHGNRLEQVIARNQWQADWQEALLLNQHDELVEATQSNIFLRKGNRLSTPELSASGVAGVMRSQILELSELLGVESRIVSLSLADLEAADEVFVSNSLIGVWPVKEFQNICFSDFQFSHNLLKILEENGAIPTL